MFDFSEDDFYFLCTVGHQASCSISTATKCMKVENWEMRKKKRLVLDSFVCAENECWNIDIGDVSAVATPLREALMRKQDTGDRYRKIVFYIDVSVYAPAEVWDWYISET